MDVVSHYLDSIGVALWREYRWVRYPAAIGVDVRTLWSRTLIPKVVKVNVLVPDFLQSGIVQSERLSFHFVSRRKLAEKAPATPAENRRALETVIFCAGAVQAHACQHRDQ